MDAYASKSTGRKNDSVFYKEIIDLSLAHLLEDFHEIPIKDATIALQRLSKQPMLDSKATQYTCIY